MLSSVVHEFICLYTQYVLGLHPVLELLHCISLKVVFLRPKMGIVFLF
jgi:hypothetical protein